MVFVLENINATLGVVNSVNALANGNGFERGEVLGEIAGSIAIGEGAGVALKGAGALIKANSTTKVFRVFGGDAEASGFSWTPKDPSTVTNFRDAAGLPSGGASGANNTGRFVIEGTVKNKNIMSSHPASALDGNAGGLKEFKINPKNVKIERVSGINPEY